MKANSRGRVIAAFVGVATLGLAGCSGGQTDDAPSDGGGDAASTLTVWVDAERVDALQDENQRLKHARLESAPLTLRLQQLEAENARLRRLLSVRERQPASGQVAQILYAARDPFSRRVLVDKGQQDKLSAGQPVVDDAGVVGLAPFVDQADQQAGAERGGQRKQRWRFQVGRFAEGSRRNGITS